MFNIFKTKKEEYNRPLESPSNTNHNQEFLMKVDDVFTISGRGTVVTGIITSGEVSLNQEVIITRTSTRTAVMGIEMFRKTENTAREGDNVGLLLRGISKDDIQPGDVLTK